jgi:tetratricopeptide (TPR) repeat protein
MKKGTGGSKIIKKALLVTVIVVLLAGVTLFFTGGRWKAMQQQSQRERSDKYVTASLDFEKSKKWDEGIAYFEKEVRKYPTSSYAHYCLGMMYANKEDIDRAITLEEKALKLNPRNAKASGALGYYYAKKGDIEKATTLYNNALTLDPDLRRTRVRLAEVLAQRGFLRDATAHFAKARMLMPELTEPTYLMGRYEANQRNFDTAVMYEQSALKDDPKNAAAHCYLGQIYAEMGEYDNSLRTYQKGLENLAGLSDDSLKRFNAIISHGMGTDYYETKDYDKAIACFTKSLELEDTPLVHKKLGDAYMKKGMNDRALTEYQLAKEFESRARGGKRARRR